MDNDVFFLNLTDLPDIDREEHKELIISARKEIAGIINEGGKNSKLEKCYYCRKPCTGFCNSHSVPDFCLRNIAFNGKVGYSNSIIRLPSIDESKGVKTAGTFNLICRECDSSIFQDYENPDNYIDRPSPKMLAQIDMKNNLKSISKRLREIQMYDSMFRKGIFNSTIKDKKCLTSQMDLKEYENAFQTAKRHSVKLNEDNYHIGYFEKLPYVVPVAFQGNIALLSDLNGGIINNIYLDNPAIVIKSVSLAIFPLKGSSIILMFVEKTNRKYRSFFKQLKKLSLEEQLSIINFILFAYTEDYFLSPIISGDTLDKLKNIVGLTQQLFSFTQISSADYFHKAKINFDYGKKDSIPNLLLKEHSLSQLEQV